MGPAGCPETSVSNYHYSLRNTDRKEQFSVTSRLKPEITHLKNSPCLTEYSVQPLQTPVRRLMMFQLNFHQLLLWFYTCSLQSAVRRQRLGAITVLVNKNKGTLHIVYVPAKISRRTRVHQREEQGWINPGRLIIVVIWILYGGA